MRIIESLEMVDQHRMPKSKKKRIRKKWAKRPTNFRASDKIAVLRETGVYICHPIIARKLRKEVGFGLGVIGGAYPTVCPNLY